ncbi:hypothetical protein [Dyadobacter sp. CY323]|uniref:hypothetical protein n=1 Tax=Dyadobacter sp. CY323 TaxID=2907302 RepID=UPI001F322A33|nr:hypothetical protein [Dyadobacter sp. CY323]MCE6991853.1 hypothetical protein [Dyadobacter sp. CY323]
MKAILSSLLAFLFLQIACQKSTEPVYDGPSIQKISFAGIPSENVIFDAPNSRITVKLPAVLDGGLKPVLELSNGARVIDGILPDNTIDLSAYCSCNTTPPDGLTLRIGDAETTTIYQLKIVASGPLKALESNKDLTFSKKSKRLEMSFPVENLYSNHTITGLVFTNVATGIATRISADGACLNICKSADPNQLMFSLGTPIEHRLEPGTYRIQLNGMDFPQRLLVTE